MPATDMAQNGAATWRHKMSAMYLTLPFNAVSLILVTVLLLLGAVMIIVSLALPSSNALCFRCWGVGFVVYVLLFTVLLMACVVALFTVYNNLWTRREMRRREHRSNESGSDRAVLMEEKDARKELVVGVTDDEVEQEETELQDAPPSIVDWMSEVKLSDDEEQENEEREEENRDKDGDVEREETQADVTNAKKRGGKTITASRLFSLFRVVLFTSGFISALAIIILSIVVLTLSHATLPSYGGSILLDKTISANITSPITIKREANGVIHIDAKTDYDAYFGQGFATAQDRLFQMDIFRKVGTGEVSAVLGRAALALDLFSRTLNLKDVSKSDFEMLSVKGKEIVRAYVDGINAYINWPGRSLSPEYSILGFEPEPWTVTQSVSWIKIMSWSLSGNFLFELDRYTLLQRGHSKSRVSKLLPEYVTDHETVLNPQEMSSLMNGTTKEERNANEEKFNMESDTAAYIPKKQLSETASNTAAASAQSSKCESTKSNIWKRKDLREDAMFTRFFDLMSIQASNNWVVGGSLTESGKPILCNDPHLGITAPNIWNLIHIKSEESGLDVMGTAFPGLPLVIIGKNKHITWGVTNGMSDVQDLYVLKDSDDKQTYTYKGASKPYVVRKEIVKIKGENDLEIDVRDSVYGPVVNDIFNIPGESVSLRWKSLDGGDTTLDAFVDIGMATNWDEFREALKLYVAPTQGFVFADKNKNIGFYAPGKIPTRKPGHTGLFPVSGDGNWDWQEDIPFDNLPHAYNPSKGYFSSANVRVHPYGYPYGFARDFVPHHRQYRIVQVLEELSKKANITVDDMKKLQYDTKSVLFEEYRWILDDIEPLVDKHQTELALLKEWDGIYRRGEEEPLIWEAFFAQLQNMSFPDTGIKSYVRYTSYILSSLKHGDEACTKHHHANGTAVRDCVDYTALAFIRAVDSLKNKYVGRIPNWGEHGVGSIDMKHQVFGNTALSCLFSRDIISPGGTALVNVANTNAVYGEYYSTHGPSYRQVIQLDDNVDSFILPLGNSGNTFSLQYDNMINMWADGEYIPMRMDGYTPSSQQIILTPSASEE